LASLTPGVQPLAVCVENQAQFCRYCAEWGGVRLALGSVVLRHGLYLREFGGEYIESKPIRSRFGAAGNKPASLTDIGLLSF
jgi:hypothetical protein